MLVTPIVTPINNTTQTVNHQIWLPSGEWIEWQTRYSLVFYRGPILINKPYGLGDIPVFVRAGAIIPMKDTNSTYNTTSDPLILNIFPGAPQGTYTLYEDSGENLDYKSGKFTLTHFHQVTNESSYSITVNMTGSSYISQPIARKYQFKFLIAGLPTKVLLNNSILIPYTIVPKYPGYWMDGTSLIIATDSLPIRQSFAINAML